MKELKRFRKKIDKTDNKILKLLDYRFHIIKELNKHKKKNNINIYDKKREKEIFKNLKKKSKIYKIRYDYIQNIFKQIIKTSKYIQNGKH